jgi:GNAT superfamily N-acetyltransferase
MAAVTREIVIRRAASAECGALTELALGAKASWGYSDEFMAACRAELTMTPQKLAAWTVWVASEDGVICGMIALAVDAAKASAEVEDFFVEPESQGRGVGGALMSTLLQECRTQGVRRLGVDADPNAEPIYRRLGFETVGLSPSGSIPGRMLPRMERGLN